MTLTPLWHETGCSHSNRTTGRSSEKPFVMSPLLDSSRAVPLSLGQILTILCQNRLVMGLPTCPKWGHAVTLGHVMI